MACMTRMAVKVTPKAPRAGGAAMFATRVFGVMSESLGLEELAVCSGRCFE